jgi:hypothetical protein
MFKLPILVVGAAVLVSLLACNGSGATKDGVVLGRVECGTLTVRGEKSADGHHGNEAIRSALRDLSLAGTGFVSNGHENRPKKAMAAHIPAFLAEPCLQALLPEKALQEQHEQQMFEEGYIWLVLLNGDIRSIPKLSDGPAREWRGGYLAFVDSDLRGSLAIPIGLQ